MNKSLEKKKKKAKQAWGNEGITFMWQGQKEDWEKKRDQQRGQPGERRGKRRKNNVMI